MNRRLVRFGSAALAAGLGYTLLRYGAWHFSRERKKREGRLGRLKSGWTRVAGLDMHARSSVSPVPAERPDVVLVHGLGVSSRYMLPIAEYLALHCRIHVPDLPGFGLSENPGHVLSIRELADALAAWMETVGLARVSFLGNSLGNEVIVELALRYPDRVDRIILQGPTPDPDARNAPQQIWRYMLTSVFEQPPLGWIAATDYAMCGPLRFAKTFRYMLEDRIEEKLPEIAVPTLVVHGSRDQIVSQSWAEHVTRLLPEGRLAVIPGASHAANFSYPTSFGEVALPFLIAPARP